MLRQTVYFKLSQAQAAGQGDLAANALIIHCMFVRAGLVSLVLLLSSRVLGLLRETAQAAAFGSSALGDVAVLMFTLPDVVAGIFISGALGYVLLPAWAGRSTAQIDMLQRRVAQVLWAQAAIILIAAFVFQNPLAKALAPGALAAGGHLGASVQTALIGGALAVPLALMAALWATRLQHARDFTGMYGANLVVNAVLVIALFLIAGCAHECWAFGLFSLKIEWWLGLALLLAGALRLAWLYGRLQRQAVRTEPTQVMGELSGLLQNLGKADDADGDASARPPPAATPAATPGASTTSLPGASTWLWACLSAGLPIALVLSARSMASGAGEGALASFNYAWKLIELPLVLAIQLVASLAFPAMAQASGAARSQAAAKALVLAWTLACAALAALLGFAQPIAQLLYGYGRMDAAGIDQVASWARVGAWSLLPQALIAVLVTLLASAQRMQGVAVVYGVALVALWLSPGLGFAGGAAMMWSLNILLALMAVVLVVLAREEWHDAHDARMPWLDLALPLALACALGYGAQQFAWNNRLLALILSALAAMIVIAFAAAASSTLRSALRR